MQCIYKDGYVAIGAVEQLGLFVGIGGFIGLWPPSDWFQLKLTDELRRRMRAEFGGKFGHSRSVPKLDFRVNRSCILTLV